MNTQQPTQFSEEEVAREYDRIFGQKGSLRDTDALYRWIVDLLSPTPGQRLLDIACGEGVLVDYARQKGMLSVGIDLSPSGARLARERSPANLIAIANGEELPFADHSYDFVTNIGSLEHFGDPRCGAREMRRVLRPGGIAAILLPNSYYLVDIIWHVWRRGESPSHNQPIERFATYQEWKALIEGAGLKVVQSHKYNFRFPRSSADWRWYWEHPKKFLNLLLGPVTPFNLSNHFLYLCTVP